MPGLVWIARRTVAVLRREGVAGTMQRAIKHVRIALGLPSRESRAYLARKAAADRAYDEAVGVDTGGTQNLGGLTIHSPNAALGGAHIATGPAHFARAMAALDIDPAGFTFVDLGAGKGRPLLMAAEYPFAAIIGVEFAEELHATCEANIARFGDARIQCTLGDAAAFAFPAQDLVVFMNNPFDPLLVKRIAERLVISACEHPRVIRVVYVNAPASDVFGPPWSGVASEDGVQVFGLPLDRAVLTARA